MVTDCKMCGVEKDILDTMMEKSIYQMKIRWRFYAVTLVITPTNFPSWS